MIDVRVCEVGLRDGLQLVSSFFPTDQKLAWIRAEAAAGVREIEVTSFVPPKLVPQFVDAEEVVREALKIPGLSVMALIPNLKGAERGFALDVHQLNFVMSVSKTHNLKNVRREREDSIADLKRIVEVRNAQPEGKRPSIVGGLSTALGCSYEGRIPVDDVRKFAAQLAECGVDEILVADTVGYGDPTQVRAVFKAVMAEVGRIPVGAHFHDTRGTGLANVAAALDVGVRRFDASLAGLGGCPFAPGASGNIVMDDLVFMLDSMGLRTGIDLDQLISVRKILKSNLPGIELYGAVAKAGLPTKYVKANARTG
jgi:hydroxymethylglutaryl-CoA lyase